MQDHTTTSTPGLLQLDGLDGGHPLGFLAALGTIANSLQACPGSRPCLRWEQRHGAWRPSLRLGLSMDEQGFVLALSEFLRQQAEHPAFNLATDLKIDTTSYRNAALTAQRQAQAADRRYADFIAAFGSEAVQSVVDKKPTGNIADTAFRTMTGAGHQHFITSMRTIALDTTAEHLHKALFASWVYDDPAERHSMRWDPMDDSRYALRWRNPSGDPQRKQAGSVWGANRLAIEGLIFYPTAPIGSMLLTTGFSEPPKEGVRWTWPIWDGWLGIDVIRSLVAHRELQQLCPDRERLAPLGVVEVYRSHRITQGKYRNFSNAIPA